MRALKKEKAKSSGNKKRQKIEEVDLNIEEVDLNIGVFVGKLKMSETKNIRMCDICNKKPGMWLHPTKSGKRVFVFLCFGCGNH